MSNIIVYSWFSFLLMLLYDFHNTAKVDNHPETPQKTYIREPIIAEIDPYIINPLKSVG